MQTQRTSHGTVHPGLLLRDTVLPALQLSVSQAARDLCIARQTLHRILAGEAAISLDMAVRLEKLCGLPWQFWIERQHRHELKRIAFENRELIPRIPSRSLPENVIKRIGALHDG
ncbi:HigA family addiction module antitoxin [Hyphomicrobium sp. LHD-15]|uniref:HigA family addiction module antitoxin n=1 Tax=Hyphomicrobium sp. LHD-15 TaxID=3072142 RepID=UPI00280F537D|nr:HigA family addiction module antitoxin [Hyphomicrobium sp. LHD-15]MDQ8697494.1 HigA family addiction module antitoxin [Hyphomicrobium sp. LHD-15]